MNKSTTRICHETAASHTVVWNPKIDTQPPSIEMFSPDYWRSRHAIRGTAAGRGEAYFLVGPQGQQWVLRHYRRGGLLSHLNRDAYLYTGTMRSRAAREFNMLACLSERGLPVPTPVAARITRSGLCYWADLIIVEIPNSETLADRLADVSLPDDMWSRLGQLIARFHAAGVWHADLNARNILIDEDGLFYLIDFDKARFRRGKSWREANLARLRRSLDKFLDHEKQFYFSEAGWQALRAGYEQLSRESL